MFRVRVRLDAEDYFLRNIHPSCYSVGTKFIFPEVKEPSREAATHLHKTLGLRMSGTILLLHLYAFMAWARVSADCLHILRVGIPCRFTIGFELTCSE